MRLALTPLYRKARRTLAGATAITAITEPFLDKAAALAGRSRQPLDRVVPLAYERIDPEPQDRQTALDFWHRQGLQLDGSERIACVFCNLSKIPELETIVDALRHINTHIQDKLRVVICGAGDRLEWLRKQANIYPQLIVPGRIGQAEIATLMEHADVGLLPYPNRHDFLISWPNKIGEYLSRGLPILSTLDGITGELLRREEIGIVTPSKNPQAFADNLESLLDRDSTTNKKMRKNASKVFVEHFDSARVYQELLNYVHRDILGQSDSWQL